MESWLLLLMVPVTLEITCFFWIYNSAHVNNRRKYISLGGPFLLHEERVSSSGSSENITTSVSKQPLQEESRTQERTVSRRESKKEVDKTLPVIWWNSKLRSRIFRAPRSWIDILLFKSFLGAAWTRVQKAKFRSMLAPVVNWFGKRLRCKRLEIFLLHDKSLDYKPTKYEYDA